MKPQKLYYISKFLMFLNACMKEYKEKTTNIYTNYNYILVKISKISQIMRMNLVKYITAAYFGPYLTFATGPFWNKSYLLKTVLFHSVSFLLFISSILSSNYSCKNTLPQTLDRVLFTPLNKQYSYGVTIASSSS